MTKSEYLAELTARARDGRFPCMSTSGECRYHLNGRACAAGVLIPDSEYDPAFEGFRYGDEKGEMNAPLTAAVKLPEGVTVKQVQECQWEHDALSGRWDAEKFIKLVTRILA